MEFLNGFFKIVLIPAAIYLTLTCLFYICVTVYFRVRYRTLDGALAFLHRYTRPHWVTFRRSRDQGIQAVQKIHRTSLLCVILGCVAIWQSLKSFETASPDWFFLLVALAMPFISGLATATARFAAYCFTLAGVDYVPNYPKGE